MKLLLAVAILFVTRTCLSQNLLNRHDHISRIEYQELKKRKGDFIPGNLGADTVIVVRYTVSRLEFLQKTARLMEFARHGEDTTGYTNESLFGKKQVADMRRYLAKDRVKFPDKKAKALTRKGIIAIVVDEGLLDNDRFYMQSERIPRALGILHDESLL